MFDSQPRQLHSYGMQAVAQYAVLDPEPPSDFLTASEFLDWLEPKIHADLISGQIFMHSPVSFKHADLLNFVDPLMRLYVEEKKLGKVYREVVAIRLNERHVFLPDLSFFSNEQVPNLKPNFAPFAPKLVVEALSPSSADRDRHQKFAAYEDNGVEEYWILDPEQFLHRFYRRSGNILREYSSLSEDLIESQVIPGFYLRRSWLNQSPQPEVKGCLAEILVRPV